MWPRPSGLAALGCRFVLTSGTGSIFGFLVARQAYQSALLAPMFIVLSFGWGQAVFLLAQSSMLAWNRQRLDPAVQQRLHRLLGVFVAASLYLVVVYHGTNLYFARQHDFEAFILRDGGIYPLLFWLGYVLLGSVLPMALVFHPRWRSGRAGADAALFGALWLLAELARGLLVTGFPWGARGYAEIGPRGEIPK